MKKIVPLLLILILIFASTACENKMSPPTENAIENTIVNTEKVTSSTTSGEVLTNAAGKIPITLSISDTVLEGYLYDSIPAHSLIDQLPLTVTLNDSDNDFCGGDLAIEYTDDDVTIGYQNGELAFWTPANNFVIFISGEENSARTGDLVKLGYITSPSEMLDTLEGKIDVTIALAENDTTFIQEGSDTMQIKITVNGTALYATLENNATTRALVEQMPMTLPMSDLYGREMCYRYGANALPTDDLRSDGYEVGDIAYWPPRGSLVLLYAQNGEQFERQHIGHIDSGIEVFENTGDTEVTFELIAN